MNVVTVAYLAVLREVAGVVAGSDAADAALVPASDVLDGKIELAFDHARIIRDAVERVRVDLELSGHRDRVRRADLHARRAALGLRGRLGRPPRRRELPPEPAVRTEGGSSPPAAARGPAPSGGKPAELYRAGRMWSYGGPIRLPQSTERGRARPMKAVVNDRYGPPEVQRLEEVERPVPEDDQVLVRVHATTVNRTDCGVRAARAVHRPLLHRAAAAEAADPRHGVRRRGRGGRPRGHGVRRRRPRLRRQGRSARTRSSSPCARARAIAHMPEGPDASRRPRPSATGRASRCRACGATLGEGTGSSSTAPRARSAPRPCSSPGTTAQT